MSTFDIVLTVQVAGIFAQAHWDGTWSKQHLVIPSNAVEQLDHFTSRMGACVKGAVGLDDDLLHHAHGLHAALFQGDLEECFIRACATHKKLLLRFIIDDPHLQQVPWEALCKPGTSEDFLAKRAGVLTVRGVSATNVFKPHAFHVPLRILVISPQGEATVQTSVEGAVGESGALFERLMGPAVNSARLFARLRKGARPDVIHFVGHGGMDEKGNPTLRLSDEDETEQWIKAESLALELATNYRGALPVIVLETCEGAKPGALGSAAELLLAREGADTVVSYLWPVRAEISLQASKAFYQALATENNTQGDVVASACAARRTLLAENVAGFSLVVHLRGHYEQPESPELSTPPQGGTKRRPSVLHLLGAVIAFIGLVVTLASFNRDKPPSRNQVISILSATTISSSRQETSMRPKGGALLERPGCGETASTGGPFVCVAPNDDVFVVGLGARDGVATQQWLVFEKIDEGASARIVAVALVDGVGSDFAKVSIFHQLEPNLENLRARKVESGETSWLGKWIARVERIGDGTVELNVGEKDGVIEGDVYTARSTTAAHQSTGHIRLMKVEERRSEGKLLDGQPVQVGQGAVFSPQTESASFAILVVDFDPMDTKDVAMAKSGREAAKAFANALGNEANFMRGVTFTYASDLHVEVTSSDAVGHQKARGLGRQNNADIVIWGAVRCGETACALAPRYTLVDPWGVSQEALVGPEMWMARDAAGVQFTGKPTDDVVGLAAGILGIVAYDAQRYRDASYLFEQAFARRGFQGEDELGGLQLWAYADYVNGQTHRALAHANELVKKASSLKKSRWEQLGWAEVARVEQVTGKAADAQKHFNDILEWSKKEHDDALLAFALSQLADLERKQGRVQVARVHYNQILEIERRTHNRRGEATALHEIARIDAQQGFLEEAQKRYKQALDIERRSANVEGEASTLHEMAALAEQQGQWVEARKLYEQALDIKKRIGNVRGQIVTQSNLALIDLQEGHRQKARDGLTSALLKAQTIGFVEDQAHVHRFLAEVELVEPSNFAASRAHFTKALSIFKQLQATHSIDVVNARLAFVDAAEKAIESWTTHADILSGGGVLVTLVVPGKEGAKSGIEPGDILIRYGSTRLEKQDSLLPVASAADANEEFELELIRGAKKLTKKVHGGLLGIKVADVPAKPETSTEQSQ